MNDLVQRMDTATENGSWSDFRDICTDIFDVSDIEDIGTYRYSIHVFETLFDYLQIWADDNNVAEAEYYFMLFRVYGYFDFMADEEYDYEEYVPEFTFNNVRMGKMMAAEAA